jgi:ApbE superfamily uncharacterized protein (UPF0280 family)
MERHEIRLGETFAAVWVDSRFVPLARAELRRQRNLLEGYISRDRDFLTSLRPHKVAAESPEIVRRMARAGHAAGVGPMAAVAGVLAELVLEALIGAGAPEAVVDNGGDVALWLRSGPCTVGIFAGPSPVRDLGLRVLPGAGKLGICTSSGTVGHSLSFGRADAALAVSPDVGLADAVATALGNDVRDDDPERLRTALESHLVEGVEGLMAVVGETIGLCGRLPEIVRVCMDVNKVSRG